MGSLVPRLKFLESSFSGATPQFPLRFFFFFSRMNIHQQEKLDFVFAVLRLHWPAECIQAEPANRMHVKNSSTPLLCQEWH